MSITKQFYLYIGFCVFLSTGNASASCLRTELPTYEIDIQMGTIVVNPTLNVGDVIIEKVEPIAENRRNIYAYCYFGTPITASVTMSTLRELGNGVYQTNIPGIGIKFHREISSVKMTYPYVYYTPLYPYSGYYLYGSKFIVTLIKTAPVTGTGALDSGYYTSYGYTPNNNPFFITKLNANAITIIPPSCQVDGGAEKNVYLAPIKRSQLNGVKTTAGEKNFNITLVCNGGVSTSGFTKINITFDGQTPEGMNKNEGVLVNQKKSPNGASGIGIQVLEHSTDKPIIFNDIYKIGTLTNSKEQKFVLNYKARYFQYAQSISAGEVYSEMVFQITYD